MGLRKLSELLEEARAGGYALGYFEAWDTHSLEAVAQAAEAEKAPVVLGFGGLMMDQQWLDRFAVEPFGAYVRQVAESLCVPATTILNEVWKPDHALRGARSGFSTVMLNTCELPYAENARLTKDLVDAVHPLGVEVQAELGRLPNFGLDANQALTDPEEAARFVRETGVDFLAISVGNVHLQTEGESPVDLARLRAIRQAVDVPLVVHGGTGYPAELIGETIKSGISLFHVGTIMKKRWCDCLVSAARALADPVDYQAVVGSRKESDLYGAPKEAVREVVRNTMRLYGASGKGA